MLKTVPIQALKPNPFRRLDEYPILREKVDPLKESIQATGFWGTIVARPHGDHFEIAFGHHRRIALQEVYPADHKVEIIVRDLTNEQMLKMMARENMEEWGTSAWVELETIRATIEAYGNGEIGLPPVPAKTPKDSIRHVPKSSLEHPFTKATVASFLGWTTQGSHGTTQPNFACETAFRALDMIDAGFLREADLKGLSRSQMHNLVQGQWTIYQAELQVAEQNRKEAETAKQKAAMTAAPAEKQRYEKQAAIHREQAEQHAVAAKQKAKDFGQKAVGMMREGHGVRDVNRLASEVKATVEKPAKVHKIDDLAERVAMKVANILRGDDDLSGDIAFLKQNKRDLSPAGASLLCQELEALAERLRKIHATFSRP